MLSIAPLLNNINRYLLNPFIILLFTIALLVFFWGLFKFIGNMDSPEEREKGRKNILYGLLGMLIMISVYGIIYVILNTFQVPPPSYIR